MLDILQIPVLTDNYIYLLHDPVSGETAVVDPALAQPVFDVLDEKGWRLTYILNTHHHWDHVGGNLKLKQKTGCQIIAAQADWARIPGIDRGVSENDVISLGKHQARVISTQAIPVGILFIILPKMGRCFAGILYLLWVAVGYLREHLCKCGLHYKN